MQHFGSGTKAPSFLALRRMQEVILPGFVEQGAAFLGKTLSLLHLVSKYKVAAEGNFTLLYFLG